MAEKDRIGSIIEKLNKLPSMSALKREEYSDEGGYADQVVRAFGETEKGQVKKENIRDALKSTQLRKVFHALKKVQLSVKKTNTFQRSQILKIVPELAYATGRDLLPREFYDLLKVCLSANKLKTKDDFLMTFHFIEAILAYHKYRSLVGYPSQEVK
jgi:CRISPR-associated protein Csm2